MGKYMDWYEVEFTRVAGKLSAERKANILESLREHIAASKAEFLNASRTEEEAEVLAIKNLGTPLDIVRAELDQPKRQWLPVWIAAIGLTWCATWLIVGSLTWTAQMVSPVVWITPVAVLIATLYSKRTKIWALAGVTGAISVLTLAVMCFTWLNLGSCGGMGFTPIWSGSEQQGIHIRMKNLEASKNTTEQIIRAYQTGNIERANELTQISPHRWKGPNINVNAVGEQVYWNVNTFEEAKASWLNSGQMVVESLEMRISREREFLSAIKNPASYNPKGVYMENALPFLGAALAIFSVLTTSHLIGLFFAHLSAHAARRKWRQLA